MRGKIFGILVVLLAAMPVLADDSIEVATAMVAPRVNLLEQMTNVEVIQDTGVATLLDAAINGAREWMEIEGYRMQVYSSNQQQTAKAEALDLEEQLRSKVTQTIYVQYLPPFWKVRIGDFRSYEEAKEYKKEFVLLFPELTGDTYIVRDKIKVLQ
jgi:predicted phosphohydrolase